MSDRRPLPLRIDLRRWCDMRHEEVRNHFAAARRQGKVLTTEDHLALHRASFLAGARAMASCAHAELAKLIEAEAQEALEAPNITPFPIAGAEDRFRRWPNAPIPQPLPE